MIDPAVQRIVVLGASGFIGKRVSDELASDQMLTLREAVRNGMQVGMPDRERVICDLADHKSLASAFAGASAVINCAIPKTISASESRRIMRDLLGEARRAGIRHVIHLSSAAVYAPTSGEVDERAPRRSGRFGYAAKKAAAEEACEEAAVDGLAVTILRPSIVYGPGGRQWTERYVACLKTGRWPDLGQLGEGPCNLVHVDDVARIIRLIIKDAPPRLEVYNLAAPGRSTWNDYLRKLNAALDLPPLKPAEIDLVREACRFDLPVRALLKLEKGGRGTMLRRLPAGASALGWAKRRWLSMPTCEEIGLFQSKLRLSTAKSERAGIAARISLDEGAASIVNSKNHTL